MKKATLSFIFLCFSMLFAGNVFAGSMVKAVQLSGDVPQHIAYTRIYDFLDELANDGIIEIRSVVKPYSRKFIAGKLYDAAERKEKLNSRQRKEVEFFLNDYALEINALEINRLPETKLTIARNENLTLAVVQPAFHYRDNYFRARITPIVGAEFQYNKNGTPASRTIGAEFQAMIGNISVWGSLRDMAFNDELLSRSQYLNNRPGYEYKESESQTANYSDSRGGIKYSTSWGSIGLVKDNVVWGDNYHGSNILSGRTPSFPMITLQLKPVSWFQLDYFHGWLVSNVIDSTRYYVENETVKHYRATNKFIAANMLTFTPVKKLNISVGNSIIYAENNVQAAYFIPIAFYKSIDHTLTKGIKSENQNSQLFFNISSRNIKHLHLYTSVFADEISFARFKPSNKETNPISYKIGAKLSNFPLPNVSLLGEYTRSNIITYKHSIPAISWASNDYNLGSYLGDNAREIYFELQYKPLRGLDLSLSYLNAVHGNEYEYLRRDQNGVKQINNIISQDFIKDKVWKNSTCEFKALYEITNNVYLGMNVTYSNIRGGKATGTAIPGEIRPENGSAQGYLDLYTPKFLQGKNFTVGGMLNIGF
ncbi:MAG: hypothetical protein LBR81_06720 [Prevotellaceae bacterium]|jgi:hypothetical protein|nr:hypothetical protein [Prevotellaceae bacterium]